MRLSLVVKYLTLAFLLCGLIPASSNAGSTQLSSTESCLVGRIKPFTDPAEFLLSESEKKLTQRFARKTLLKTRYVEEPEINMVTLWDGNRSIANVDFELLEDGVLELGVMSVNPNYRRAGISSVLLAKILAKYPKIREIRMGSFTHETNYEVVEDALNRGKTLKEALQETPAYLLRARLGFSKIVPGSIDEETFGFSVRRP